MIGLSEDRRHILDCQASYKGIKFLDLKKKKEKKASSDEKVEVKQPVKANKRDGSL